MTEFRPPLIPVTEAHTRDGGNSHILERWGWFFSVLFRFCCPFCSPLVSPALLVPFRILGALRAPVSLPSPARPPNTCYRIPVTEILSQLIPVTSRVSRVLIPVTGMLCIFSMALQHESVFADETEARKAAKSLGLELGGKGH